MKAGTTAMIQKPRDRVPKEACWLSHTLEGQTEQIHPQNLHDPFFLTALA